MHSFMCTIVHSSFSIKWSSLSWLYIKSFWGNLEKCWCSDHWHPWPNWLFLGDSVPTKWSINYKQRKFTHLTNGKLYTVIVASVIIKTWHLVSRHESAYYSFFCTSSPHYNFSVPRESALVAGYREPGPAATVLPSVTFYTKGHKSV